MVFGPGDMQANFSLVIYDDNALEAAENFSLTLIIPRLVRAIGVEEGAPLSASGVIMSDDSELLCTSCI